MYVPLLIYRCSFFFNITCAIFVYRLFNMQLGNSQLQCTTLSLPIHVVHFQLHQPIIVNLENGLLFLFYLCWRMGNGGRGAIIPCRYQQKAILDKHRKPVTAVLPFRVRFQIFNNNLPPQPIYPQTLEYFLDLPLCSLNGEIIHFIHHQSSIIKKQHV